MLLQKTLSSVDMDKSGISMCIQKQIYLWNRFHLLLLLFLFDFGGCVAWECFPFPQVSCGFVQPHSCWTNDCDARRSCKGKRQGGRRKLNECVMKDSQGALILFPYQWLFDGQSLISNIRPPTNKYYCVIRIGARNDKGRVIFTIFPVLVTVNQIGRVCIGTTISNGHQYVR